MAINAALAYQSNKINTSNPAELTLMLFDGAIKFCNIALIAIDEKNIKKASTNIIKTENIISYLRETLDFKYPVAQEFDTIYDYVFRRLVTANIRKDREVLEEALSYIREMRDTWKEVMKNSKVGAI